MKFSKIRKVKSPTRGTEFSAGIDFYVPERNKQFLDDLFAKNHERCWLEYMEDGSEGIMFNGDILIPSGIKVQVPKGHALIAFNKSGVSTKLKLDVGASVVDEDYQGEIHLHLFGPDGYDRFIEFGQKIIQFLLVPINYSMPQEVELDSLYTESTERGEGGFGSTGDK